ncbi:MAG TPA: ABC-F family ATP-binding cassette domain-containing protein [Kiritimatiellia bacterium]|nr:ABC-F family ATP-binding cassette domain-containing protein [Kiritimatiellia bacterium]
MIEFSNVSKAYGAQVILSGVSFLIGDQERVGLVGMNGVGKSTVFELIAGTVPADRGSINISGGRRMAHLRQVLKPEHQELSLIAYTETALPEIAELQQEIIEVEHRLHAAEADKESLLGQLGRLQSQFEAAGGYTIRTRASVTLGGLGFREDQFDRPLADFSGGWQMRAELARTLTADPDILLLDEPSNFLDVPAVEWLQRFLKQFKGTLILISHDRFLLNSLTGTTLEMAGGEVTRYKGNYDWYVSQRAQRVENAAAALKNQQRKREQMERFVERFRAKNTLATRVKSKIKMIERMEVIEVPVELRTRGRLRLPEPAHSGHEVVRLEDAGYSYDGANWVLRDLNLSIHRGQKIALVGLNGMGKTTLLRMLAGQLVPGEGKRVLGHKVVPGYQSQETTETIPLDLTLLAAIKQAAPAMYEQQARTLLGGFGFSGDAVLKRVEVLSGGERIRLAFARLLANPPNFMILDEPTTHLDIPSREQLEGALRDYTGTLCFVSHDIDFVRHVADGIISLHPPGIRFWHGGYDYYKEKQAELGLDAPVREQTESPKDDKKAQRRARAEARAALSEKTRPVKKDISEIEKRMEKLEREQDEIVAALSENSPGLDFAKTNRRLSELQWEISHAMQRWEELSLEMEELAGENRPEIGD